MGSNCPLLCPICRKEWNYHSETETSSCGKNMIEKIQDYFNEVEDLWNK